MAFWPSCQNIWLASPTALDQDVCDGGRALIPTEVTTQLKVTSRLPFIPWKQPIFPVNSLLNWLVGLQAIEPFPAVPTHPVSDRAWVQMRIGRCHHHPVMAWGGWICIPAFTSPKSAMLSLTPAEREPFWIFSLQLLTCNHLQIPLPTPPLIPLKSPVSVREEEWQGVRRRIEGKKIDE